MKNYSKPIVEAIDFKPSAFICDSEGLLPFFQDGTNDGQGWGTDPTD